MARGQEESDMGIYLMLGLCVILLVVILVMAIQLKKTKQTLELTSKELTQTTSRLHKTDGMYRETLLGKENLNTIYEELKEQYERANRLAYTDPVTELPNRQQFEEILDGVIKTLRSTESAALSILEFPDLRKVGDVLGRSSQNELLMDLTQRLKANIGFQDEYLARVGEDSFAVIHQNFDHAGELEERLGKLFRILKTPLQSGGRVLTPRIYGACAIAPKDGKTAQLLFMNAELALCEARRRGEDNYCYYENEFAVKAMQQMEMQVDLRRAFREEQMGFAYGAQVNLRTNQIEAYEVVLQWKHPTRGTLAMSDFRALLAESEFCMTAFTSLVTEAFRRQKEWEEKGYRDLQVAIPCLTRQLLDDDFAKTVYDALQNTGANPARIVFQISADALADKTREVPDMLKKLTRSGFRFVLDDYGFEKLPFSVLFSAPLQGVIFGNSLLAAEGADAEKMLQTLIPMLHTLRLKVLVRDIALEDQSDFLRRVGCDLAQGELYGAYLGEEMAVQYLRMSSAERRRK